MLSFIMLSFIGSSSSLCQHSLGDSHSGPFLILSIGRDSAKINVSGEIAPKLTLEPEGCQYDVFDIKKKIDDLTLTSTLACHHFGEISAIEQADDVRTNSRCAL